MRTHDDLTCVQSARASVLRSAVAIVAVAIGAVACGGGGGTEPSDPELAQGQDIWAARCSVCHGPNGEGGVGPPTGGGAVVESLPDIAVHVDVVTNGRRSMPAWRDILTAEEIDAVVRYQREELGR